MATRHKILTDANGILSAGKTGGQTLNGGIAQTETLTLIGNAATASGTNIIGGDVSIKAQPGTGTGASSLHFFTGTTLTTGSTLQTSSEKMTILGSGDVGIGTTSPGYKLDVVGSIGVGNTSNASKLVVLSSELTSSGNDGTLRISSIDNGSLVSNFFMGNDPSYATYSNIWAGGVTPSTTNYAWQLKNDSSEIWFNSTNYQYFTISNNTSNGMVLRSGGNVGIGTGYPTLNAQLTVKGNGTSTEITLQTQNSSGNPLVTMLNNGNVGIGTTAPTNLLSFGGNSARIVWMERHTTADTAGNTLTIKAGGATVAATNKAGGQLIIAPGLSTGTGESGVTIQGCPAGSTGTADGTLADMIKVLGNKLAFYNSNPIAQAVLATGASHTVDDVITHLQNLGLCKQS